MTAPIQFTDLQLHPKVLEALQDVGYETPSPIQAEVIPSLLQGSDLVGLAQTGTGKTAAFALPLLSQINLKTASPQLLVLTPTRELAIQVAEAFQRYASRLKGFRVLPVYGGQDYRGQLNALKRGVHVVVGTPGRLMDHMRRGSLDLSALQAVVLDEADEMLRMGFIEDVEWILEQAPEDRQTALFSATMPNAVSRIAKTYLNDPIEVRVKQKTRTADTIRQRCWPVSGLHKLDALTRILEGETFDAVIIFVRTKTATVELSDKLQARGYGSAALNGDLAQNLRERTIKRLKDGGIDIVVATDVAARGLDVDRISHVINYDIPYDTEAYIHRIGRTGRAGRQGDAILFVANRERRLLKAIERATGHPIETMALPSADAINQKRIEQFNERLSSCIEKAALEPYEQLIQQYLMANDVAPERVAAALARMLQGDEPLLLKEVAPAPSRDELDRPRGKKKKFKSRKRNDGEYKGKRSKGDWDKKKDKKSKYAEKGDDRPRGKSSDKYQDKSQDKTHEKPKSRKKASNADTSTRKPRKRPVKRS
jgi:ATP-dependent RNA helicase DeaD